MIFLPTFFNKVPRAVKQVEENKPLLYCGLMLTGTLLFLLGYHYGKKKDDLAQTLINLNLKHENEILKLNNEIERLRPI